MRCTATEGKQVHPAPNIKQSMSNEYKFYVVMCQSNYDACLDVDAQFSPSVHPHQQLYPSTQNQHTLSILCPKSGRIFMKINQMTEKENFLVKFHLNMNIKANQN